MCVTSGRCTLLTTTHLKSHQCSSISAKITTQEFFFFTEAKKAHNSSTKNEERATETEALSETKQSQRSAHTMERSCPFFLAMHRKQPHPSGCESTRHHSTNTAHTEEVIPVQKQMHTASSSSDVKTTCRSLRFHPRATRRVSFLVVRKTSTATFTQRHHCNST